MARIPTETARRTSEDTDSDNDGIPDSASKGIPQVVRIPMETVRRTSRIRIPIMMGFPDSIEGDSSRRSRIQTETAPLISSDTDSVMTMAFPDSLEA